MTGNLMCRVCLQTCKIDNFQSIFQSDLSDWNDNTKIFIKICECSGILINEKDEYSNIICHNCMNDLNIAYKFRKRCQLSDKKLKRLMTIEDDTRKKEIKDEFTNSSEEVEIILKLDPKICYDKNKDLTSYKKFSKKVDVEKIVELKEQVEKLNNKCAKKDTNISPSNNKDKQICTSKQKSEVKFPCKYCDNNYSGKITLRYHMRKHTNEMHYVCELCGTAFETNYKLKRHKMTHTGEKPYSCRFCERKFLHSSNRNLHEKRLHTHIKNHQCEYCAKAFHTPCQLRKHIRVHTGEKPYICDLCGTGFKAKSHLTAHMHSLVPCVVKINLKKKIESKK